MRNFNGRSKDGSWVMSSLIQTPDISKRYQRRREELIITLGSLSHISHNFN